jgi:hypothetical protein
VEKRSFGDGAKKGGSVCNPKPSRFLKMTQPGEADNSLMIVDAVITRCCMVNLKKKDAELAEDAHLSTSRSSAPFLHASMGSMQALTLACPSHLERRIFLRVVSDLLNSGTE